MTPSNLVAPTAPRLALLDPQSPDAAIRAGAGGKAANLHRLQEAGLRAPEWRVIPPEAFRAFAEHAGVAPRLQALLDELTADNAEAVADEAQALLDAAPTCAEVLDLVWQAWGDLGPDPVAVRSSALVEDGAQHSFAGQFASFLNLSSGEEVWDGVRACWRSAFSPRILLYCVQRGVRPDPFGIACLVQRMIPAERSGVVFTRDPLTGGDRIVISGVYGVGEGLVSGEIDADTVTIDRSSRRQVSTIIGEKATGYFAAAGGGLETRAIPPERSAALSLEPVLIDQLVELALRAEAFFGGPQDIEWCEAEGELFLLQSRPITSVSAAADLGDAKIWDNSNIIESFGEVTLPLTASFAQSVYSSVFQEYAHILGVPHAQLSGMRRWLRSMLGYHNGRVYYDLLNWYKMIRIAPFYSVNRRAMELSMGVQTLLSAEAAERLDPYEGMARHTRVWLRAKAAVRFVGYFFCIEAVVNRFVTRFETHHRAADTLPVDDLAPEEIFQAFDEYRIQFIREWGKTILLEQAISLSIGALMVCIKAWLPKAPEMFLFQAVKPHGELESLKPVEAMERLADLAQRTPGVVAMLESLDETKALTVMAVSADPAVAAFAQEAETYRAAYGYRSFNELKLEERDMREDPAILVRMLKGALPAGERRTVEAALDVDDYVRRHLDPLRRMIFEAIRRKASRGLAARERTRFCRTKVFGTTRKMLKAMGRKLAEQRLLREADDIFYLRLEELTAWCDGGANHAEYPELVAVRRRQMAAAAEYDGPPRFETRSLLSETTYRAAGWRFSEGEGAADTTVRQLVGTPSCPGTATGLAAVLHAPANVGGRIMVTYKTDPGWCPVLPSASALLIERGSPLTHVAIVARELGIPTVTQIRGLTARVATDMLLVVDGAAGTVDLPLAPLEPAPSAKAASDEVPQ